MPRLRILLRVLLILTFSLEGSLSVWATSDMAVDSALQVAVAEQPSPVAIDQDCADEASAEQAGAVHEDCDCEKGLGCACACVFPAVAFTPVIAFAAQHLLANVPEVPSRLLVVVAATTPVFRPPIG